MISIDSTLWINIFEVMITMYFTIIYEKISHGVGSCICVEISVIVGRY